MVHRQKSTPGSVQDNIADLYKDEEAFADYQEISLEARSKQKISFPPLHKV